MLEVAESTIECKLRSVLSQTFKGRENVLVDEMICLFFWFFCSRKKERVVSNTKKKSLKNVSFYCILLDDSSMYNIIFFIYTRLAMTTGFVIYSFILVENICWVVLMIKRYVLGILKINDAQKHLLHTNILQPRSVSFYMLAFLLCRTTRCLFTLSLSVLFVE